MSKIEKKTQPKDEKKVLNPTPMGNGVRTVIKPMVTSNNNIAEPQKGQVFMVRLDVMGNEIPNSGVYIGERTYNKFYANRKDFKLKKKA